MEVSCPQCGNRLPVSSDNADEQGLARLTCDNCRKRLQVKVSRPELKIGATETEPAPPQRSFSPPAAPAPPPNAGEAITWTLSVVEFPTESLTALRTALRQVPRYSRSPNKVFDITAQLPYQFTHLTFEEVSRLEACLADWGARYQAIPPS